MKLAVVDVLTPLLDFLAVLLFLGLLWCAFTAVTGLLSMLVDAANSVRRAVCNVAERVEAIKQHAYWNGLYGTVPNRLELLAYGIVPRLRRDYQEGIAMRHCTSRSIEL